MNLTIEIIFERFFQRKLLDFYSSRRNEYSMMSTIENVIAMNFTIEIIFEWFYHRKRLAYSEPRLTKKIPYNWISQWKYFPIISSLENTFIMNFS